MSKKYSTTAVFNKPSVKAAMRTRAQRLRVGSDWVLMELKRVYDRCMEKQKVCDIYGHPTGEYKWDSKGAISALNSIGKHCDVKAFDPKEAQSQRNEDLVELLIRGRQRVEQAKALSVDDVLPEPVEQDSPPVDLPDFINTPPVEPDPQPETVDVDPPDSEPELTDEDKLKRLMAKWRSG